MRLGNIRIYYIPKDKKKFNYQHHINTMAMVLFKSVDIIRTNTIDGVRTTIVTRQNSSSISDIRNVICYLAIAYIIYLYMQKRGEKEDEY